MQKPLVTPLALRSAVTKTGRRRQCACIHASAASARSAPATLAMRIFLGALIAAQCSAANTTKVALVGRAALCKSVRLCRRTLARGGRRGPGAAGGGGGAGGGGAS